MEDGVGGELDAVGHAGRVEDEHVAVGLPVVGQAGDGEASEGDEGSVVGPIDDPFGNTKLGLQFETVVNRTKFGLNWNAPLPKGGFMLANDVTLSVDLELLQA